MTLDRKKVGIGIFVVLAIVALVNGPTRNNPSTYTTPYSAPTNTYVQDAIDRTTREINSLTSCPELQDAFDTAYANHKRAQPGSEQALAATRFMEVADDRMREIGCYK